MNVQRLSLADAERLGAPGVAAQLRAQVPAAASVEQPVREIIERVRSEGDAAVVDLTRRLDTGGAEPLPLRVTRDELDVALKALPLDLVAGLQVAIANVAAVAQAGVSEDATVTLPQGQRVVVREVPVRSAAVYVPGGRAPYPSTVVMGVVTARAAGVLDVAVCAPPGASDDIHPVILGTCRLLGVPVIYRMGGAQAIAALAHGTETVQRADVVVGPGNLWVQEAKRQLCGIVGIDSFAGPSDLLVIADPSADVSLMALDLAAQAEHGPETMVAALCPSEATLDALQAELAHLAEAYPQLAPAACVLAATSDLRFALHVADSYAPEHLQLVGPDAEALAPLVQTAGCLFVGPASGTAFGDYVAGSNHVLPTGGAARFSSSLSPRHFRRRMSEVHIELAADKLARAGAPIARAEGFVVHAASMEARQN